MLESTKDSMAKFELGTPVTKGGILSSADIGQQIVTQQVTFLPLRPAPFVNKHKNSPAATPAVLC
jgi:hypothetical protein